MRSYSGERACRGSSLRRECVCDARHDREVLAADWFIGHALDVQQLPALIEQRRLGAVEASHQFEPSVRVSRQPVALPALRRGRTEPEVDGTVAGAVAGAAIDIIEHFGKGTISRAILPVPGTKMTLQERAYTSPIWYTPGG